MTPKDSYHLVSMLLCNPVPLSVDWTQRLTTNQQNFGTVMVSLLSLGYEKDWSAMGFPLSLSYSFSPGETNCHVVSCPMERPTWQRTEGSSKPTASKELRSSGSKSMKSCMLSQDMQKPGSGFSSQLAPWRQPWERLWGRGTQPSCVWILDP